MPFYSQCSKAMAQLVRTTLIVGTKTQFRDSLPSTTAKLHSGRLSAV